MFSTWHGLWRFEDLNRTFAGKVLHDKAFNITKDPQYDGYQCGLASMVYKFLIKNFLVVVLLWIKLQIKQNMGR